MFNSRRALIWLGGLLLPLVGCANSIPTALSLFPSETTIVSEVPPELASTDSTSFLVSTFIGVFSDRISPGDQEIYRFTTVTPGFINLLFTTEPGEDAVTFQLTGESVGFNAETFPPFFIRVPSQGPDINISPAELRVNADESIVRVTGIIPAGNYEVLVSREASSFDDDEPRRYVLRVR